VSNPVVTYKETVTRGSEKQLLAKSQNKLNRMIGNAELLSFDLQETIENGKIDLNKDTKSIAAILTSEYEWDKESALGIWCFGPEGVGANCLVDQTKAVQNMNEIKDSVVNAFQRATRKGVLIEETIRGLRVNIIDASMHADSNHRKEAQIGPMARRLFYGNQLEAYPSLFEPIFMCEVSCPPDAMGGVYQVLTKRRAKILEEENHGNINIVKSYLPIAESFGLTSSLREHTQGKAFPQCLFDHWEMIKGDVFEEGSVAQNLVKEIRKRKGLKDEIPTLDQFIDKY